MKRNSGIIGSQQYNSQTDNGGIHELFDQYNARKDDNWVLNDAQGQQNFTTAGQDTWTVPNGVASVCFVLIGGGGGGSASTWVNNGEAGGGGGGGALSWRNNYSVTPGDTLYITVGEGGEGGGPAGTNDAQDGADSYIRLTSHSGTIIGRAGGGERGAYDSETLTSYGGVNYSTSYGGGGTTSGGGTGGEGGHGSQGNTGGGGGGAGGYSGTGGSGNGGTGNDATSGSGGGGGGGGGVNSYNEGNVVYGGGGTDIYGEGANGAESLSSNTAGNNSNIQGYRGSEEGPGGTSNAKTKSYGGGGAGNEDDGDDNGADGGDGAVRIIWGVGRSYPATLTLDQTEVTVGG